MEYKRLRRIEKALAPKKQPSIAVIFEDCVSFNGNTMSLADYEEIKSDNDLRIIFHIPRSTRRCVQ